MICCLNNVNSPFNKIKQKVKLIEYLYIAKCLFALMFFICFLVTAIFDPGIFIDNKFNELMGYTNIVVFLEILPARACGAFIHMFTSFFITKFCELSSRSLYNKVNDDTVRLTYLEEKFVSHVFFMNKFLIYSINWFSIVFVVSPVENSLLHYISFLQYIPIHVITMTFNFLIPKIIYKEEIPLWHWITLILHFTSSISLTVLMAIGLGKDSYPGLFQNIDYIPWGTTCAIDILWMVSYIFLKMPNNKTYIDTLMEETETEVGNAVVVSV